MLCELAHEVYLEPVRPLPRPHKIGIPGIRVAPATCMLKLVGSYVLAKLLGFGILGAIVIYLLLSLLT